MFLYFYVDGLDGKNGPDDPNYKFAQSFENGGLNEKVIEDLNTNWRAKKVGLDFDANRKEAKNQARIEFWSFTGVKMDDITVKQNSFSPRELKIKLKEMRTKNAEICAREIKRMADLQKAREKAEGGPAADGTAAK